MRLIIDHVGSPENHASVLVLRLREQLGHMAGGSRQPGVAVKAVPVTYAFTCTHGDHHL